MLRVRKAALMTLRIFLILSACCGICTIIIWVLGPSMINSLDAKIVSGYVKYYESSYNGAIKDLGKGRGEEGSEKLKRLLEDLDYVKKGDRLDPLKRRILNKLIRQKIMGGEESEALKYFQTLIAFDERDLGVQIRLAEFLRYNVGRKEEAENMVKKLYKQFPSAPIVADVYAYLVNSSVVRNVTPAEGKVRIDSTNFLGKQFRRILIFCFAAACMPEYGNLKCTFR